MEWGKNVSCNTQNNNQTRHNQLYTVLSSNRRQIDQHKIQKEEDKQKNENRAEAAAVYSAHCISGINSENEINTNTFNSKVTSNECNKTNYQIKSIELQWTSCVRLIFRWKNW